MFWNDDVQAPAERFIDKVAKQFDRRIVPALNRSLHIRKDNCIRSLVNNEVKNINVIIANPQVHRSLPRVRSSSTQLRSPARGGDGPTEDCL